MSFQSLTQLLDTVSGQLPAGLHLVAKAPGDRPGALYPVESAAIARAVTKRREEFVAGRLAARCAMRALGYPDRAVPMAEDRSPIWPEGLVGSISHCSFAAVCAVAGCDSLGAVGIDVETDEDLPADLLGSVCGAEELNPEDPGAGQLGKRIFSAKEAAYKAQYAISATIFGFDGLAVQMTGTGTDLAVFTRDVLPFRQGQGLEVRQWTAPGVILSLSWLPALGPCGT